ncbi:TetR/AcrR family transcriptional regulator [Amycolatopsis sp. NPDC059027]|uniref:TetR/AcrR family transcriptional regulator n=1 Tax=Amycolatopsis sp. NPDC059027 TaxID=3346709 RepID=UPI00366B4DA6
MPVDGRLARGAATRRTVLRHAVDVASVDGLDGLSLGRLATELELSKSGVFALFGSKEDLQLATIQAADEIFAGHVLRPTSEAAPGMARLRALCDNWLAYSERRIFPGGCFFFNVGAEFDARPGRVHDAIAAAGKAFTGFIADIVAEAARLGELAPGVDVAQLAFTLHALGRAANAEAVLHGGSGAYRLARECMHAQLDTAAR